MSRSSLFLEILLYLHSYYFAVFVLLEISFGIYKVITLPFQNNNVIMESLIMLFLVCIELVRVYLARKGNLTETLVPLILSTVLTGPAILGVLYLLLWQTYVLWLELVFCYIQLVLQGLQCILSFVSIDDTAIAPTGFKWELGRGLHLVPQEELDLAAAY